MDFKAYRPMALLGLAGAVAAFGAAGCGEDDVTSTVGLDAEQGGKIALLLPERKTTRYETQDRPRFEAAVRVSCSDCEVLYANAEQDASTQQQQAEAAIADGAKVLVLDPVDAEAAGAIVTRAREANVPVISYDRLVAGGAAPDYFVSFDNEAVGRLQGESLVAQLGGEAAEGKQIVMINGSPADGNATQFKNGARSVIERSGLKIGREYDTPGWRPVEARRQMEQAIKALGRGAIDGVYAANDGTAGGAISAMKSAGIDPTKVPSTGQDAELAAVRRVLVGEQGMTVYKAIKPEAQKAAQLAVALVRGDPPPEGLINGTVNSEAADIPSVILDPVAVTRKNIKDTVIADGFLTARELCSGRYAAPCEEVGIGRP